MASCNKVSAGMALLFLVALSAIPSSRAAVYVDWSKNACVDDSDNQPWNNLYGSLVECCSKAFSWKDDCDVTPPPSAAPTRPPTGTELRPPPSPRPAEPLPTKDSLASTTPTHAALRPSPHPVREDPPPPTPPRGQFVKIEPSDDTYIDWSRTHKSFGGRTKLRIESRKKCAREALIGFDLAPVRGECVESATLWLYALSNSTSGGVVTTLVPNQLPSRRRWSEHRATWHSIKSTMKIYAVVTRLGRVRRRKWVGIDVTAELTRDPDQRYLTFGITSEGPGVRYASKERRRRAPKLAITLC